ncbi:uncharacterized protein LOC113229824 isoform X2 [Hyposmocoma kahamanoa]|uniref:uncharacterized protein LOC113229824 isoform X2 n=1 Tax=Hyposmocoma kahamanoa TaxID=1477025 RepID=UPI000E6D62E2|nr:uncharacterized protein LOC113229824 isoform X2 [Hyposmocoma kahamanoa]
MERYFPPCDCKFCPVRHCPYGKPEDVVPISMPKRKLKPRPKLADDDVCKKHQPKYECGLPKRSPLPKFKRKKPSLLEMIADKDCACELIARSVGAGGVHHHIGLRDLRETINMNAQKSTIDEESIETAPELTENKSNH